jgi:ABC-2 type transport system permease protein
MIRYFHLFAAFFRINVVSEMAYRFNFIWQLFQSMLNLGVSLAGFSIIFSYTESIGGWRMNEILALIGVYFLVGGFIGMVVQPGMEELINSVRDGTLDFTVTKPHDTQLLVSVKKINIWRFIDICLGLGVLIYALVKIGAVIGGWEAAAFILMLICGGVIIYSFFLILATLSFWFVRMENILLIFQSMYEAGRWPVSLYPPWLRYGLTFVIPVAFATTVPAEAITGRLEWLTMVIAVAIAVFLIVVSRVIWKIGLRHYTGTSE